MGRRSKRLFQTRVNRSNERQWRKKQPYLDTGCKARRQMGRKRRWIRGSRQKGKVDIQWVRQSSSSKKKDHRWKLEGQRSKNRKLKDRWSLQYPWQCQVRVHHRLRSRPNRITLSRYFQSANMIEISDIEVTQDECVCSLVTFDDAIPRLSWKPFVTTTTSPWMVSLAHSPYLLEKWSASLKSTCVASWRQGLHSGIDPTVRTQSCQLLEVISGSFTQGGFRRLLCWWLRPSHQRDNDSRTIMRRFTTCCPRTALLKENRWHVGLKNSTHTDFLLRQPCPIRGDATWHHVRARRVAPRVPDAVRCRAWFLYLPTSCTWAEDECKTRRQIPKRINSWSESEDSFRFF